MEPTASTRWLLRPIGIIKRNEGLSTSAIKDFGFVNAYVKDRNYETDLTHPLYVLFKQDHFISTFSDFIQYEYERGLLLEDYDYPEGYVVLLYDYPDTFKTDYDKILKGKYSQTSTDFQACFPKKIIVDGVEEDTMYFRTFTRNEKLKKIMEDRFGFELPEDAEVWKSPYIDFVPDITYIGEDGLSKNLMDEVPSETLDIYKLLKYEEDKS